MATARALISNEWPRLDLAKHHVSSLRMQWSLPLPPEFDPIFADLLDDEGGFMSFLSYSKGKVPHARSELVFRDPEQQKLTVNLRYDAGDERFRDRTLFSKRQKSDALDRLIQVDFRGDIQCSAQLEYPNDADLVTVFPLPFVASPSAEIELPFDEIRGIRGVKLATSDGNAGYNFILDRASNEEFSVGVNFELTGSLANSVPAVALSTAVSIANRIVFRIGS